MSEPKFYIYGGGRWRKVDINEGRVEGWGRARFVYPRRGKVHTAKTKSVLTALKNLAARKKSCAKDGARLPEKKLSLLINKTEKLDREVACDLPHCCQHATQNGYMSKQNKTHISTQCTMKVDAGIQTTQSLFAENGQKMRQSSCSNNITIENTTHRTPRKNLSLKRKRSISNENVGRSPKKRVPSLKLQKEVLQKTADVWVVVPKETEGVLEGTNSTKQKNSELNDSKSKSSQNETVSRVFDKTQDQCKELIIDETDVNALRKYLLKHSKSFDPLRFELDDDYKRQFFFKINPLVNVDRCPKIAKMLKQRQMHFVTQLGLTSTSEISPKSRYRMRKNRNTTDSDKENTRKRKDTDNFEANYISSSESDTSMSIDLKKSKIPYGTSKNNENRQNSRLDAINQSSDSSDSSNNSNEIRSNKFKNTQMNSKDPSKTKKSSSDSSDSNTNKISPIKKTQVKTIKSSQLQEKSISDSEEEFKSRKESSRIKGNSKKLKQNENSAPNKLIIEKTDNDNDRLAKKVAAHLSSEVKTSLHLSSEVKTSPHFISKKPSVTTMREYSNLEDHAIVSWVSVGNRAQCVNGNKIWMELHEQFQRLTGQSRTFHSLRNRYLRYILPSLGNLALPPSHIARLRAAAATGDLKARKASSRRNSIFALPTRGALSRRPGALHDTTEPNNNEMERSESPPKSRPGPSTHRKSPRYSEITRNFAATHRQEDSTPTDTPTHSPTNKKPMENSRKSRETSKKSLERKMPPDDSNKSSNRAQKSLDRSKKSPDRSKKFLDRSKKSPERSKKSIDSKKSPALQFDDSSSDISDSQVMLRRSLRVNEQTSSRGTRSRKLFNPVAIL